MFFIKKNSFTFWVKEGKVNHGIATQFFAKLVQGGNVIPSTPNEQFTSSHRLRENRKNLFPLSLENGTSRKRNCGQ